MRSRQTPKNSATPDVIFIDSLSIAAWNVGGVKSKLDDPEFTRQLEAHDIIILLETFAENEILSLPGYKSKNIFRSKKHKKARRNSGGVSVLTKNCLSNFVQQVKTTSEHFIWLKIKKNLTGYPKDLYLCCAYIPPYGSPYYKSHPDIDFFDLLSADLVNFGKLGHIMISGDLNARIGKRSETLTPTDFNIHNSDEGFHEPLFTPPPRHSMDNTTNSWGMKLIDVCLSHNLCLLNGRKVCDFAGNFTFFGGGCSVIDITIVDSFIFNKALSFKVHPFLPDLSLHCKIECVLACSPINLNVNDPTVQDLTFDKYVWDSNTSLEKLMIATGTPEFNKLKNEILSSAYEENAEGLDSLLEDVNSIFKFLHDECCEKIIAGKKSRGKRKRKKWFSADLTSLRKRLRKAANFLNRARPPHDRAARIEVFTLNKNYRKMRKKAKKVHDLANMQKLVESVDKSELWSILSEIKGKTYSPTIPMHEHHAHYTKIFNNPPRNVPSQKLDMITEKINTFLVPPDTNVSPNIKIGCYTPEGIKTTVRTLKNGKSSFLDGSINEVIKNSISHTAPILARLFNHIEATAIFPSSWKSSFLVPLHKKGSPDDPDNYRGLAVGNNIGKLYTKCLNSKITKFTSENRIISPHQFGFQEDFRTSDAIFSLRSMVSLYKNENKPVYGCFVDFSKAFDSVDRTALIYKLGCCGIRGKTLRLIQNMYDSAEYVIKNDGKFSLPISSKFGVKQGCNLSPLLFNIFINDLHEIFSSNCDPLDVDNWKINSLSFADDLVLLSETESGLKNCLASLERYCQEWGLRVNPDKTKVLVFNKPYTKNIKNLEFKIDGNPIAVTNSYTYLGVEISNTLHFAKATDALYKKGLKALFGIYSCIDVHADQNNIPLFLKLFDSLIKPIILYGSEVWGCSSTSLNGPINKFTNKFYRTLLGSRRCSSTAGIHCELGRSPIHVSIQQAMIKYWFRLISLPKNRLVSHCYRALPDSDVWCKTVESIVNSTGQYCVWSDQKTIATQPKRSRRSLEKYICRTIDDLALQTYSEKIGTETKLSPLNDTKSMNQIANYLHHIKNRQKRTYFAQMRLGTLELEIEKGRRFDVPRAERVCNVCNFNEVENAEHFIFECVALNSCRTKTINSICTLYPDFSNLSNNEKIRYLFFNENLPPELVNLAADLLFKLKIARDAFNKNDVISLINIGK